MQEQGGVQSQTLGGDETLSSHRPNNPGLLLQHKFLVCFLEAGGAFIPLNSLSAKKKTNAKY